MEESPFVETLKGMRIGGRYIVDRVLGSGGMGIIAIARYPELQQKVAIKFLRPEYAADALLNARFVREARVAAKVKSEHFVRVFDIGKLVNGVPYLVMELLSGNDLGEELAVRGVLAPDVAIDYVLQAAVGIAEIHALGIVHRDLKPSNLFVAEGAGKRMIKVLDFGISKETDTAGSAPLTATEHLLGTPQYMSPEQVRASKEVDSRSDIWSLGVILYELVTGKRPFVSAENATGELFAMVLFSDPTSPRTHRPELDAGLEAVILKCLARDRAARFSSVGELAEALRPYVTGPSLHRIEAVQQALTARQQSVNPPPLDDEAERLSQAATAASSPSPKRAALASAPSAAVTPSPASEDDASKRSGAPVTSMTSSTSSARARAAAGKRNRWAIVVVASVVVTGAVAFAISSGARSEVPASSGTVGSAVPPQTTTASASAASAVPTPSPLLSAEAVGASASAPPRLARPPVTRVSPPPVKSVVAPPAATPTSAKSVSTGDLILDRK